MSDSTELTIIEQQEVAFHDEYVTAVLVNVDGREQVYVPLRPICKQLGLNWAGQTQRIDRDPILSKYVISVRVVTERSDQSSRRPKTSYMKALPLDKFNGWLFGVNVRRAKPDVRDQLMRYQEECYQVLADAFGRRQLTTDTDPMIDELLKTDSPSAQAYKMIMAMAQMAKQQLLHEARLNQMGAVVESHEKRIDFLEATIGSQDRLITNAQASKISQGVKAIALELGKRSGRNEFGGVYGELYRRFEIAGYRELAAADFEEAMLFLNEWYSSLSGQNIPF